MKHPLRSLAALSLAALAAACTPSPAPNTAQPDAAQHDAGAKPPDSAQHDAGAKPPDSAQQDPLARLSMAAPSGSARVDDMLRLAQEKIRRIPSRHEPWVELAEAWVRKAREAQDPTLYRRAQDAAQEALRLKPDDNAPALRVLGLVAREQHDFAKLRELASKLTQQNPQDASAWGLLGDAALELGDYKASEDAYQKMLDLRPGLPAYSRAAWLRWLTGDPDGALELWDEAIRAGAERDPEPLAYCLTEAGHVEWSRGRLDAALARYEAALKVKPDHAGALLGRGRVRLAQGDGAGAVTDLDASLKARRLEETFLWLMDAKRAAGQGAEADQMEAQLLKGSALDDPRTVSVWLSTRDKEPARALALAQEDAKQRGDLYTQDALALALWRNGKLPEAEALVGKMLALGTPDPKLLAHGGLILAGCGKPDLARPLLEKALALNPMFDPGLAPAVRAALDKLPKATP
jgi:tetratricopeptide (TPR) repeat protein